MQALRPTRYLSTPLAATGEFRAPLPPTLATLSRRGIPAGLALTVAILGTLVLTVGLSTLLGPIG